jgi:hypothetical protein
VPAQNTPAKKPTGSSTSKASHSKSGAKAPSAHSKSAAKSGSKAATAHAKAPASAHVKASGKSGKTTAKRGKKGSSKAAWRSRQLAPTPERYKDIQSALGTRGYLQQTPTGVWDAPSADALRRFQQDQNLEPSGKLNSLSLIALGLGAKRPVAPASARPVVITPQAPRVQGPETPAAPVANPAVTEPRVPDSTSPAPANPAPPSPNQPNPAPPNI